MKRLLQLGLALALLIGLLTLVRRVNPLPLGLRASYFPTEDWSGPAALSVIDRQPSISSVLAAWSNRPPPVFSVMWSGSLLVPLGGDYTFATTSDDGSWVFVDGQPLLDLGGRHPALTATRSVQLERGVHAILIKYFQAGGDLDLRVSWSRGDRSLEPIPAWALTPKRPSFWRFAAEAVMERSLAALEWLWLGIVLIAIAAASCPHIARAFVAVRRDAVWRALAAVIAGSLALNVIGIWYGLSAQTSWLGDEIGPLEVITPISQLFSHGWWAWYPPLHYYILAAAYAPVLVLERLGRIHLGSGVLRFEVLMITGRLVSIAAGAGVLIAVYLSGAEAFSRRAGVFAAASLALVGLFICYSKTTNVEMPYLFWFAISILFYLRFVKEPTLRNIVLFAAAGTAAICTKDQAYGLFVGTPIVIVYAIWRDRRQAGDEHPFASALFDRRILSAAATVALLFAVCHNVFFNYSGFLAHVRFITTDARIVRDYGVYDPMLLERLRVLWLTASLDQRSMGWPLLLASIAGWCLALRSHSFRTPAVALSIVLLSYYLTFINVIMYCYDRFLLPVCLVQALFAGVAFDRWLEASARYLPARRVAVGGALAYSLLYGGMVDALMLRDSRYTVEAWIRGHASAGDTIGAAFEDRNRPALDGFRVSVIDTVEQLAWDTPTFYLFDADYARGIAADSPMSTLMAGLRGGTLGYRLVLKYRSPAPWAWLPAAHPELVGPRLDRSTSSLREINPTFEVYAREP